MADAKVAPDPIENTYNKIQLCVCFPSETTQKLTLNFTEKDDNNAPDEVGQSPNSYIEIVSITMLRDDYQTKSEFKRLNELYNIFMQIQHEENFSIVKNDKIEIEIKGIDDNIFKTKSFGKEKTLNNLNKLNLYINHLISLVNPPVTDPPVTGGKKRKNSRTAKKRPNKKSGKSLRNK